MFITCITIVSRLAGMPSLKHFLLGVLTPRRILHAIYYSYKLKNFHSFTWWQVERSESSCVTRCRLCDVDKLKSQSHAVLLTVISVICHIERPESCYHGYSLISVILPHWEARVMCYHGYSLICGIATLRGQSHAFTMVTHWRDLVKQVNNKVKLMMVCIGNLKLEQKFQLLFAVPLPINMIKS